MMSQGNDRLIPIVGTAYFQPIADLLDRLTSLPYVKPNDIQAGRQENGYSAAICILSVVCFESFLMRVRYMNKGSTTSPERKSLLFLKSLYPNFALLDQLTEVYILRDILAHNHLWEIDFSWNDESPMVLTRAALDPVSGDTKYQSFVDHQKKETKLLKLNILPVRVNRQDVCKVLSTVWDALLQLETKDRNQCYVSDQYVKHNTAMVKFGDIVSDLRGSALA